MTMKSLFHCSIAVAVAACGSVTSTTDTADLPQVTSVTPDNGSVAGGTMVTIAGKNLSKGAPYVVVGIHGATMVTAASDTMLSFVLPPGDEEGSTVDITVANNNGFGTKAKAFTYNLQPVITSVAPPLGKASGGTMVTITGRGFQANNAGSPKIGVADGTPATNVTVVDDKTITAVIGAAGSSAKPFTPVDLTVSNNNGTGRLAGGFRVTAPGLLVIDRNTPSRLFHVDLTTGAVSPPIASASRHLSSCTLNLTTNIVYALGRNPTSSAHELVTLDPLTGAAVAIGPLNDAGAVNHAISSMVFIGNTLYGLDLGRPAPSRRLVTINTATGAITVIGATATTIPQGSGIAIKDANTVYVVQRPNASLDTMAIASSVVTTGLPLAGSADTTSTPSAVNIGGTLYLLERNNPGAIVFSLNPSTAVLTKLAQVLTPSLAGAMCQTPTTF